MALDDDNDDVAWALQTAGVQWNRGGRADAIVWLRRAVDTAVDLGLHERAQELNRMTEALDAFVQAGGEFGPVGTGPASSGTASSSDVDALLDGRSALPSVELRIVRDRQPEPGRRSRSSRLGQRRSRPILTDSVPDLVGEIDIEQPVEDEADDEIEVLDDVEPARRGRDRGDRRGRGRRRGSASRRAHRLSAATTSAQSAPSATQSAAASTRPAAVAARTPTPATATQRGEGRGAAAKRTTCLAVE